MCRVLLYSIFTAVILFLTAQAEDLRCNVKIVKSLQDSIAQASENLIVRYYQTFDTSCTRDVDFSEWSNQVLFDLLDKRTESALKALSAVNDFTRWLVLRELENPVNPEINLDALAKKISDVKEPSRIKTRVLVALKKMARFHVIDTMYEE
jgi:hypothetical protein